MDSCDIKYYEEYQNNLYDLTNYPYSWFAWGLYQWYNFFGSFLGWFGGPVKFEELFRAYSEYMKVEYILYRTPYKYNARNLLSW